MIESAHLDIRRKIFSWLSPEDKRAYISEIVRRKIMRIAPVGSVLFFDDGKIGIVVASADAIRYVCVILSEKCLVRVEMIYYGAIRKCPRTNEWFVL